MLETCLSGASLIDFPRGAALMRQGEEADAAYVIVAGTAQVVLEKPDGSADLIDLLSAGDCVGDLAILLDQPRTASVRAIRNCRAIRIGRSDFLQLHARDPVFALRLARIVAQRLQRTTRERVRKKTVSDVAIIALGASALVRAGVDALAAALPALPGPAVRCHLAQDSEALLSCIAEADIVLLALEAGARREDAGIVSLLDSIARVEPRPDVAVMLCHDAADIVVHRRAGLDGLRVYHARMGRAADVSRIARLVTGRAIGLALSGGGARGFAHIGVIRALEDSGIPIDFIAGTSMGAIIAAQYAAGFDPARMIEETRRAYVRPQGWPDYALPTVALYSGRATDRKLKRMFDDRLIQDLPLPYFAVAADLSTAQPVVLDTGPVWQAARISSSVPGLLPPVAIGGRLLVDGGLLDNLPAEALRQRCGGRLIASDVSVGVEFDQLPPRHMWPWSQPRPRLPGIGQIMMRTAQLASVRDSRNAVTPADLYLNPSLNDVGMSDFGRLEELVERGAAHARDRLQHWENMA